MCHVVPDYLARYASQIYLPFEMTELYQYSCLRCLFLRYHGLLGLIRLTVTHTERLETKLGSRGSSGSHHEDSSYKVGSYTTDSNSCIQSQNTGTNPIDHPVCLP